MRYLVLPFLLGLFLVDLVVSLDKEQDCKCRIQSQKRVIGGRKADPMSFPWQVSLQRMERIPVPDSMRPMIPDREKIRLHFCGGVIINERWILTASHCLAIWNNSNEFRVGYGSNDLVTHYDRKQYAEVEEFHMHPESGFLRNDIGLIKLKTPLTFTKAVQPACLPDHHETHYEGALKVSGFGKTEYPINDYKSGSASRFLREAEIYDFSDDPKMKCSIEMEICVENRVDPSQGICHGDSGGPLHYTKGGRTTVIGATSYGLPKVDQDTKNTIHCAGPYGYTRISRYMDWIQKTIGNDICV